MRCGALFDGKSDQLEPNMVITVERDRIKQVDNFSPPAGAHVIALADLTCLPGMVELGRPSGRPRRDVDQQIGP
jgi:dihydroorotase-like cyclic amidohydrolase